MNTHLPVLIVGAGPSGLMMACELARHGVSFRIIDKKKERTSSSNATWIQTHTLEIFDHIGVIDRFLKAGHPCDAIHVHAAGKHLLKMPLNMIQSLYPFVLMLPQSETENLLNQRLEELHHRVERPLELIDIKYDEHGAMSMIQHADGHMETITSDWVIACDGASSKVREKCGFHFSGEDIAEQFMVADATIDFSYLSKNEIHFFFDQGTLFVAFPLGENKYRIAANLHLDYSRKIFTAREVIEIVQERAHGEYYVTDIAWISPFWVHSKIVEQMREGPLFLVGDAAHIHSPAIGQGMNTGLQDAYNLAWKLALVIQKKAKPLLLDTYHTERYPVVKAVVNQNEYFTKMALFNKNFLTKLHQFCKRILLNIERSSKKIGMSITQLDTQYKNSPIIHYQKSLKVKSPQPGERAPDIRINPSTSLHQYFRHTKHTLLIFSGLSTSKSHAVKINELKQCIAKQDDSLIKIYFVSVYQLTDTDNYIFDENAAIHHQYNVKKPSLYLIRPDNYIAYRSSQVDFDAVEKFLETYLVGK